MKISAVFAILPLLWIVSCGGSGSGGDSGPQREEIEAGEAVDGVYHAHLRVLNPRASGFLPHGGATFRVNGDELSVKTYLDDDSSVTHRQSVHTGTRCPDLTDDRNGDGFIDYKEALKAVGPVLIPLDSDITGQDKGAEVYPKGSSFTYNETAFISEILSDLYLADPNSKDEFTKLKRGQGLRLVGRVVLVHGTFTYPGLPATLATRGSEAANMALPVVCGVIAPVQ